MAETSKSIEVKALEKDYGSFRAVKSVSFDVFKGEIYGFLGANGAGKSTTIKMLCGLLEPTSGMANVAGFDVIKKPEEVKRHIGYMCQKYSLYQEFTPFENLKFFGGIYGLKGQQLTKRVNEIIDMFDLSSLADSPSGLIPRGYQQRLSLGCSIIHKPEIIFLDEPTAGVDPLQRRNFWNIINQFSREGTTIFVTTHFLDEAEFCNRISFIVDGNIVAEDTPRVLKENLKKRWSDKTREPNLEDVFIDLAEANREP